MVTTVSSSKPVKSPFDILNSQLEKDSDAVDQINVPIKKIFDDVLKPTELAPLTNNEAKKVLSKTTTNQKSFLAPQEVIIYLERLIFEKRPLKSLKFDIEESGSIEDVAKLLADSKLLSVVEKQDMLKIIGLENFLSGASESLNQELTVARKYYISFLGPYIRKSRIDKEGYQKLMADLGVKKEMPKRNEPKELTLARSEYENLKHRIRETISENRVESDLSEAETFSSELIKIVKPEAILLPEKLFTVWDRSINNKTIDFLLAEKEILPKKESVIQKNDDSIPEVSKISINPPVENSSIQKEVYEIESTNPKEEKFPSEYEGNNVLVIRVKGEKADSIRVLFNEKEIALGGISKKGLEISIKPEFKAGWLFAKTPEERAFKKKILPFLKTFKY